MITKKTKYKKIIEIKDAEKILSKYKVPCVTCPMARMEMDSLTLEQIGNWYNINVEEIIKEINKKPKKKIKNKKD